MLNSIITILLIIILAPVILVTGFIVLGIILFLIMGAIAIIIITISEIVERIKLKLGGRRKNEKMD